MARVAQQSAAPLSAGLARRRLTALGPSDRNCARERAIGSPVDFKKPPGFAVTRDRTSSLADEAELPPVVARMVVELRSDGTRTVARGAIEDLNSGERVAIRADASTPLALANELARTLLKTPLLARETIKAVLPAFVRRKL
jgi:hypothetical protein